MRNVPEPTGEQCTSEEKVYEDEHCFGHAIWYPQMGGYVGKAVALFDKRWCENERGATGGCIDVLVWHDGDWPFHDGEQPRELHHCDPEQFVRFGKTLARINNKGRVSCDA